MAQESFGYSSHINFVGVAKFKNTALSREAAPPAQKNAMIYRAANSSVYLGKM